MQFFVFLTIVFAIIIIVRVRAQIKAVNSFNESAYHKITGNTYYETLSDVGKNGEYLIYNKLRYLESEVCKFLFNVYIPKENGETTEIDVMMISPIGIIVFESKNYSGWIFGNENDRKWTQVLPKGRGKSNKEHFYNPIMQNETHIKWLKNIIDGECPIFSMIVFSERCTFKDVVVCNPDVRVIKQDRIVNVVEQLISLSGENLISIEEILKIYDTLYPYSQVSNEVKQEHIENINNHYR